MTAFNVYTLASSIFFTVFGILGNSLEIYVFSTPKFREVSLFRYLLVAAIVNIYNAINVWPTSYAALFEITSKRLNCILYLFLNNVFGEFGAWILVLSSFDRFLSIKYPHFKLRNELRFQAFAMLIVLIVLIIINIPMVLEYQIIDSSNTSICHTNPSSEALFINIALLIIWVVIPFILMILSTSLIAYQLLVAMKRTLRKDKKQFKKTVKFVKLVLVLDLYFLICYLPSTILVFVTVFYLLNDISFVIDNLNTLTYATDVCNFLNNIFFCFEFALFLIFNKLFRDHVLTMFGLKQKKFI